MIRAPFTCSSSPYSFFCPSPSRLKLKNCFEISNLYLSGTNHHVMSGENWIRIKRGRELAELERAPKTSKMNPLIYISTFITYGRTKLGESGKVAQKQILEWKLEFYKVNISPEDEVIFYHLLGCSKTNFGPMKTKAPHPMLRTLYVVFSTRWSPRVS